MLDIGGDRGALVIYTSEGLLGEEIEIRPHDGGWTGLHTAVRLRQMGDLVRYAGVFGSLAAGLWDLRIRHGHSHGDQAHVHAAVDSEIRTVKVEAGTVVESTF